MKLWSLVILILACGVELPAMASPVDSLAVSLPDSSESRSENSDDGLRPAMRFSLSTYRWNYAPWMRSLATELSNNWETPEGCDLKSAQGNTKISIFVGPEGALKDIRILEFEGPKALHGAALQSVQSLTSPRPLPKHFSEEQLEVILNFNYSARQ